MHIDSVERAWSVNGGGRPYIYICTHNLGFILDFCVRRQSVIHTKVRMPVQNTYLTCIDSGNND